jgi:hypothetical protein
MGRGLVFYQTIAILPGRSEGLMAFSVQEIQPTPNPNAAKFILDKPIADRPISFLTPESGKDHPLASRLFEIPGVCGLLMLNDFLTVSKRPEAKWDAIRRSVKRVLLSD